MSKSKFTFEENRMLTEIYRRLNFFHKGDVTRPLVLLEVPSRAKCLISMGIIRPSLSETPRVYNWYDLTLKGKEYFKNYIEDIQLSENEVLFNGEIKTFDKSLLP